MRHDNQKLIEDMPLRVGALGVERGSARGGGLAPWELEEPRNGQPLRVTGQSLTLPATKAGEIVANGRDAMALD